VDRILFAGRLGENRMAPNTAINFVLCGIALALLDRRVRGSFRVSQGAVLVASAITFASLAGYLYGIDTFYGVVGFIPMALNTALGFVVLCGGILAARPQRDPMRTISSDTTGGIMQRRLLPAAIIIPLLLGWLRLRGEQAGLYDTETGIALFAAAIVYIFVLLVWWTGRRTARIAHELRVARDAAERAARTQSEFLANMSHEIRTPMNGIIGMTELVLQHRPQPRQRERLITVQQSADALLHLLNDILDFSKIEAGRLDLEAIPFNLRDTVGNTLHALALGATEKGIELAHRIAPDVPDSLVGDPGRLRQVLVNLAGNAIKFTERGEVVVDVTVEQETVGEAVLRFAVRDTGIGIPPDKQAQIFGVHAGGQLHDAAATAGPAWASPSVAAGHPDGRTHVGRERGRPRQHVPLHARLRSAAARCVRARCSGPIARRPARAGRGRQRHEPPHPRRDAAELGTAPHCHGRRRAGTRSPPRRRR
jgi:two-component system, sensor histidine kinase and response regulator